MGWAVLYRSGTKHDGIAILDKARPLGEPGHAPELEAQWAPRELAFDSLNHIFFSLLSGGRGGRAF
jgi:hypothetical protein